MFKSNQTSQLSVDIKDTLKKHYKVSCISPEYRHMYKCSFEYYLDSYQTGQWLW